MRRIVYGFLFLAVLAIVLVASMPLSFVLKRSGVSATGLNWSGAAGTVFSGEMSGVRFGAQPIGDVSLKLQPGEFVKGRVSYKVNWSGLASTGETIVGVGADTVLVSGLNASFAVEHLVGLAGDIRRSGGSATVSNASITFREQACRSAAGTVSTDTVARALTTYGISGGILTGSMACDGPMLQLPVSGETGTGDRIEALLRVGFAEPSSAEARITTEAAEVGNLLVLQGFEPSNGTYTYRREAQLGGF